MKIMVRMAVGVVVVAIMAAVGFGFFHNSGKRPINSGNEDLRFAYDKARAYFESADTPTLKRPPETRAEFPADKGSMFSAVEFYKVLSQKTPGNFVFSPLSLRKAMALLNLGAGGNTESEISRAMHFSDDLAPSYWYDVLARMDTLKNSGKISLENADALFVNKNITLSACYLSSAKEEFRPDIMPVVFSNPETLSLINGWVSEKTRGLIRNVIGGEDLSPDAMLVIIDTLYFKGQWACRFYENGTRTGQFFQPSGKSVAVPMMHNLARYQYAGNSMVQILELPYAEGLSMIVVLPVKNNGLVGLFSNMVGDSLALFMNEMEEKEVSVSLPKFAVNSDLDLKDSCMALGMKDAFNPKAADFTSLSGEKGLYVSEIKQMATITVDEKGAEASAATMVMMPLDHTPTDRFVKFNADHPFAFLILETKSRTVLFMGRVENPAG